MDDLSVSCEWHSMFCSVCHTREKQPENSIFKHISFQTDQYNIISVLNNINIISHKKKRTEDIHSLPLNFLSSLINSAHIIIIIISALSVLHLISLSLSLPALQGKIGFASGSEVHWNNVSLSQQILRDLLPIFLRSAHGAKFANTSAVFPDILTTRS